MKEETFIQTDRRGGDGQLGQKRLVARWWLGDQRRQYHICMWINQEEHLGSETDHVTQDSREEIKPQNLWL